MAAKRTAFGDVSNTAHGTRLSKDDSIVKVREIGPAPEKAVIVSQEMRAPVILQEKKAPALSKPAQRPITVSSLKNLLTGSSTTASNDVTSKRTSTNDSNLTNQTANTRKTLTKRSTTIFKDTSLPAPVETQHAVPTVPRAPLHQILNPPPPAAAAVEPEKNRNPASQIPISDLSVEENDSLEHGLLPSQRHKQLKSDGPHLSDYQITYAQPPRSSLPQLHQPAIRSTDLVGSNVPNHTDMPNDAKVSGAASRIDTLPSRCSQILPSESEEYWDDEEDDNFAEDGYVTARSYRSRGDGTTGLGTTVLFPRCTKSVQQELAAAKQLVEATRTREDWEDEAFDTSMVAEYGDEIFTYLKELEVCHIPLLYMLMSAADTYSQVKMLPNAHYMDNQAEIQWSMRSVLMDWLVQVHHRFGLLPETLFLAVNYIDRFLSCKVVSIGKLQLVGATAIFIAAKYEEINCPSVQEIVYMVDGGYSIEEILKAERFMLGMLQFELGWPGPMSFLRRISKADDYDLETRTLAKYFLEITIMDERFVGSPPSFTSAGAHCLSRLILRKGIWVCYFDSPFKSNLTC